MIEPARTTHRHDAPPAPADHDPGSDRAPEQEVWQLLGRRASVILEARDRGGLRIWEERARGWLFGINRTWVDHGRRPG